MDPVSHAVILAIIAALAVYLGVLDEKTIEITDEEKPPHVQVICARSPEECPPGGTAGRVPAVGAGGVLPPATGDSPP